MTRGRAPVRGDREARDRGEATAQLVILIPILILMVFLGIQTAIFFHAANVASAAASQGAAAGSRRGSGSGDAITAAHQTLSDLGVSTSASASADRSAEFIVVTVEVAVSSVLPFFPDTATRTAIEPNERFVPESGR